MWHKNEDKVANKKDMMEEERNQVYVEGEERRIKKKTKAKTVKRGGCGERGKDRSLGEHGRKEEGCCVRVGHAGETLEERRR